MTIETGIALGWLLITGAGLMLTAYMVTATRDDAKNLRKSGVNGDLLALAKLSIWQEVRRFFIKVSLFAIGVASFFHHQKPTPRTDGFGWVFIVVLYATVGLLNYSTFSAIRYRQRFLKHMSSGTESPSR